MNNFKKTVGALAIAGALACASIAYAQNTHPANSHPAASGGMAGSPMTASKDSAFVKKAAAANMTEINASKLAADHASSDSVKSFADTMIHDHTAAGEELMAVLQRENRPEPSSTLPPQNQSEVTKLQGLNGAAFDKAYSKTMLKDHKAAVALFKKEARSGKDAELKAFASKTAPTLEHHLAMVKKLPGNSGM